MLGNDDDNNAATAPLGVNWTDSEAFAQTTFNAHLVTVDDAAENQLLYDTFAVPNGGRGLWIGSPSPASARSAS
jgi:hypothetical protein